VPSPSCGLTYAFDAGPGSINTAKRPVERLDIPDLTADRIARFLSSLETDRHNSIATGNARLGAIDVFARFMAAHRPEYLGSLQRLIGMPFKRGARDAPIEYLERREMDALLHSIDRTSRLGRRDYALFALMFNIGTRVQAVLDLRVCPLWPTTARLLTGLTTEAVASSEDPANRLLFTNARGGHLTRDGVRYLLRGYIKKAIPDAPTLRGKKLHPHSLRHDTAVAPPRGGRLLIDGSDLVGCCGGCDQAFAERPTADSRRGRLCPGNGPYWP
jgi:integrase/recombinase XerD